MTIRRFVAAAVAAAALLAYTAGPASAGATWCRVTDKFQGAQCT